MDPPVFSYYHAQTVKARFRLGRDKFPLMQLCLPRCATKLRLFLVTLCAADPDTKAWLDSHCDPVFGFPSLVRCCRLPLWAGWFVFEAGDVIGRSLFWWDGTERLSGSWQ